MGDVRMLVSDYLNFTFIIFTFWIILHSQNQSNVLAHLIYFILFLYLREKKIERITITIKTKNKLKKFKLKRTTRDEHYFVSFVGWAPMVSASFKLLQPDILKAYYVSNSQRNILISTYNSPREVKPQKWSKNIVN